MPKKENNMRWGKLNEYRNVNEWKEATFGDVNKTWDPIRKDGFGGYASVNDWKRATFRPKKTKK